MEENEDQVIVPVLSEEVHADAVPVKTGGIRVTKHLEGHDEILEQELRKERVQVKRVKTERIVDGPQPVRHVGNTVIVPVVSERLRIEKEWVITEEIHITQLEERETVEQKVRVNEEHASVERVDAEGNPVASVAPTEELPRVPEEKSVVSGTAHTRATQSAGERVLSKRSTMLQQRRRDEQAE